MPVITAYVSDSKIFGLFVKSAKEFEFFDFPYLYTPQLFSNYIDEASFYKAVFETFCKKFKTTLTKCPVYITGLVESTGFDQFNKIPLDLVLNSFQSFYPVLVNSYSLVTKNAIVSEVPNDFVSDETTKQDIYANLSIYPNLSFSDNSSRFHADSLLITAAIKNKLALPNNLPVLFMGSRFLNSTSTSSDYLLLLNLFPMAGVYNLCLDKSNSMILSATLKMLPTSSIAENSDVPILEESVEHIGTLISTTGSVECLVKSEVGTAQLFDVEPDSVFVIPLSKDVKNKVVIKNQVLGVVEKELVGGTLGLIFDTRSKKDVFMGASGVFDSLVKTIEEATQAF